jgi:hypothetical protein
MLMYSKYWQILLFEWRKQGRDGLTIPFLIGSQRYFPGTEAFQDIAALITDIATSNDFEVYIGYCMDIKQLILGVRSGNKLKIAGNHLLFENGQQSRLFITKFVDNLGEELDSIITALTEMFQSYIDQEQYSINQKEWGGYSADELDFIQSCANTMKS